MCVFMYKVRAFLCPEHGATAIEYAFLITLAVGLCLVLIGAL